MQLPDPALNAAQLCLQKLGLVFQVKLPRQGYVKRYFDDQVKSFCEDKKIDLQPGVDPDAPLWTFMMVKKRGNNATLRVELLSQREMTAQYLGGREFKLRNYLAEGGDDNILLIGTCSSLPSYVPDLKLSVVAPMHADLKGAINIPEVGTRMKHTCHVSRLDAAIQGRIGQCNSACGLESEPDTGNSSGHGTWRTLAQVGLDPGSGSRRGTGRTLTW